MFSINTNKKSKYLMAVILVLCVMLLSVANAATNLSNATVELYSDSGLTKKVTNSTYTYDTKAKKPYVKVTVDGAVVPSSQYEIEYLNNTIANDNLSEEYWAHVKVTGDGTNTIGYAYASFVINRLDLFSSNIEFEITGSKVYDGKITRPKVTKSRLKTSDGSYVDLGWTALKFDGTDAGVGGFDEVSCVNLLNVGFYHVWAFGTNYKNYVERWVFVFPKPLVCTWAPNTFVYDGKEHVPTPTFSTGVAKEEVIGYDLVGKKIEPGKNYPASATVTKIKVNHDYYTTDRQMLGLNSSQYLTYKQVSSYDELYLNNYILVPGAFNVSSYENICLNYNPTVTLQHGTEAQDYEPHYDTIQVSQDMYSYLQSKGAIDPGNYTFNTKFDITDAGDKVIKDPDVSDPEDKVYKGTEWIQDPEVIVDGVTLIKDVDYTVEYIDNIDAGTATIIVTGIGDYSGTVTKTFEITPAPLTVKADDKSKDQGDPNPELTYTVTGAVNGEKPAFDGELDTNCKTNSPEGTYPIYCDGQLTAKVNGGFKPSNYKITYKDGSLSVGEPSVLNPNAEGLCVDLRSGSPNPNKANPNHYRIVDEEVIYWVDYINAGEPTNAPVKLVLNLPLDCKMLDADGGTYDPKRHTVTWTFPDGLDEYEGGTKEVHLKYTKFSKSGITDEHIYPLATIGLQNTIADKSAVHNIVYTDGVDVNISHKVYMWGDADTPTFRPTDYISRAEGAMVLLRIFDISYQDVDVKGTEFPDLNETYEQAQKGIVKAARLGLVDGYEDGTYRPNRPMTNGEFFKLIAVYVELKAKEDGIEGITLDDTKSVYKYAASNNWSNKYVTLLNRLNLTPISKKNPNLRVDDKITRAEVAQLCNLYLFRCPVFDDGRIDLPFEDVTKATEHWGDIVEATRPTHDTYDVSHDTYEVWDYNDWKEAYEKGFTNKYLY